MIAVSMQRHAPAASPGTGHTLLHRCGWASDIEVHNRGFSSGFHCNSRGAKILEYRLAFVGHFAERPSFSPLKRREAINNIERSVTEDGMRSRALGNTGIQIAPLVLGGNVFGWTVDEPHSFELLDRAAAAGLNTIDTADSYSSWVPGNVGGESETILGTWLKRSGRRDTTVVITKVGSAVGPYPKDLTAKHVLAAAEDSLRRLQTDHIDVYFSHWPDPSTRHDETLAAYQTLIKQGKVRTIGASNYSAQQMQDALATAAKNSLPRYQVVQPEYNLYDRSNFEGDLQNLCAAENIGVITYFSLAQGFLSGKYRTKADFGKSPRGENMGKYMNARGQNILAALDQVAKRHSAKLVEVALAWLMVQPSVTAPIASATSIEQVQSLTLAASLKLSKIELDLLKNAG